LLSAHTHLTWHELRRKVRTMTGPELKAYRQRHAIRPTQLAERLDLGRTRVHQIEAQAVVAQPVADRYIFAVLQLAQEAKATA
jgi:DNA-binding transcriptional regulator YiaG